jgi:dTMP kinase
MTAETELLLMNASRAQLVREIIRPALGANEIVLCDRFFDSTIAYQAYGRQLELKRVQSMIDFAVGETRPHLTLLLMVPIAVSEARRHQRQATVLNASPNAAPVRDRMEEADGQFFKRVEQGYQAISAAEPKRVRVIDATQSAEAVHAQIWEWVAPLVD